MKIRTVMIPHTTLEQLKKIVEAGIFPNVSEAIRTILTLSLPRYMKLIENRENDTEESHVVISKKQWKESPIIPVKIPPGLLELLEAERRKMGCNRSMFIRMAIVKALLENRVETE
jgi:Arc/MetJ-type ribon-helix-helix transcriptional regulator